MNIARGVPQLVVPTLVVSFMVYEVRFPDVLTFSAHLTPEVPNAVGLVPGFVEALLNGIVSNGHPIVIVLGVVGPVFGATVLIDAKTMLLFHAIPGELDEGRVGPLTEARMVFTRSDLVPFALRLFVLINLAPGVTLDDTMVFEIKYHASGHVTFCLRHLQKDTGISEAILLSRSERGQGEGKRGFHHV